MTTPAYPEFPGAVGFSRLNAYPWPTADDAHGGSPHMHLTCAEAYIVLHGRGRLQTLNRSGPTTQTLTPGDVVWFTPGTIHRAVNDGDLQVLVIMQNSGLPEAGDAVMTFPPAYLTRDTYPGAASLAGADSPPDPTRARARRDLAVEGFTTLLHQWKQGDSQALEDFYTAAVNLTAPRLAEWERIIADGAAATAEAALANIDGLRHGDTSHLDLASVHRIAGPPGITLGMCGFLTAYDPVRRRGPRP